MKRQTGFYLTEKAREWLKTEAIERGISRSDVIQEMINGKIEQDRAKKQQKSETEGWR